MYLVDIKQLLMYGILLCKLNSEQLLQFPNDSVMNLASKDLKLIH
jgi:hypothetical protein